MLVTSLLGMPSSEPSAKPTPLSTELPNSQKGALPISTGAIVGIGIGVAAFVVCMSLIVLGIWKSRKDAVGMKSETQMTNPLVSDFNAEEEEEPGAGYKNSRSSMHRWSDLFRGSRYQQPFLSSRCLLHPICSSLTH
jgi:hypothetical protein